MPALVPISSWIRWKRNRLIIFWLAGVSLDDISSHEISIRSYFVLPFSVSIYFLTVSVLPTSIFIHFCACFSPMPISTSFSCPLISPILPLFPSLCLCLAQILASGNHLESEMLFITEQFDFFSSALDSLLGMDDVIDTADPGPLIRKFSPADIDGSVAVIESHSSDVRWQRGNAWGSEWYSGDAGAKVNGSHSSASLISERSLVQCWAVLWCGVASRVACTVPQDSIQRLSLLCGSDWQRLQFRLQCASKALSSE